MIESLQVREAIAGKDFGNIDSNCFQLVYENEIISLRTNNVSEKRQWINQVESAIKTLQTKAKLNSINLNPGAGVSAIGTLNVMLIKAVRSSSKVPPLNGDIFAYTKVGDQMLKSKIVDAKGKEAVFNQYFIHSLQSMDEILKISIHHYDKYSADGIKRLIIAYLGQAEFPLDILEYYCGKETEVIELPFKDSANFAKILIKMSYRPA
jgi:hypothetical protein